MNFVLYKLLPGVFTLSLPISSDCFLEWNHIISLFSPFFGTNLVACMHDFLVRFSVLSNTFYSPFNYFHMIDAFEWGNWKLITFLILFFPGIVLLLSGACVFFSKKQERVRMREFRWKSNLQIKSLQYQLDPHFIFNALNSMQSYILEEQKEKALDCLSDFSNVLRKKIEHADRDFISLWEEIEYLQLYLKLEQMRFSNKFSFYFHVSHSINSHQLKLPPMFIHPFLENAINSRLAGLEGDGILNVNFKLDGDDFLRCIITDNGLGREKEKDANQPSNSKNYSKSLQITKDRMDLLNKMQHEGKFYSYVIEDVEDENGFSKGTRVEITFPKQESSYFK